MSDTVYSIAEIKNIVSPIAAKHGVDRVYLFGSYARGEASPESDIDLRLDAGRIRGLFQLGGLYADLEESLDKTLDLITTGGMSQAFQTRIRHEELLIYEA